MKMRFLKLIMAVGVFISLAACETTEGLIVKNGEYSSDTSTFFSSGKVTFVNSTDPSQVYVQQLTFSLGFNAVSTNPPEANPLPPGNATYKLKVELVRADNGETVTFVSKEFMHVLRNPAENPDPFVFVYPEITATVYYKIDICNYMQTGIACDPNESIADVAFNTKRIPVFIPPSPSSCPIDFAAYIQQVDQFMSDISSSITQMQALLNNARQEKDLIKVNCLDDKLTRANAASRLAQEKKALFDGAIVNCDDAARNHNQMLIEVYRNNVLSLKQEADSCVGGSAEPSQI